jgi:hypothetical protein
MFFFFIVVFRRQQQLAPYKLKCDKEPLNNKYAYTSYQRQFTQGVKWVFINLDVNLSGIAFPLLSLPFVLTLAVLFA